MCTCKHINTKLQNQVSNKVGCQQNKAKQKTISYYIISFIILYSTYTPHRQYYALPLCGALN